jgi:hypothetical protein
MKMKSKVVSSSLRCSLIAACLLWLSIPSQAQISSGGTPPSQQFTLRSAVPAVQMPSVDAQDYLAEDAQETKDVPLRFGVPFEVALNLDNSGEWTELPDGARLWRLRIEAPGAYSINLVYDQYFMPAGGKFFIYNERYEFVIGAFTESNNKDHGMFGTQPVPGDVSILEYYEPASVRGQGRISVMRVVHAYRNMFGYANSLDSFGSSGSCNNNVACDDEWNDQERGVVMLLTSGGSRYCSGSLINNANNDGTPYVLTANHCSPGATDVAMFNYQSPTCSPNTDGPTTQSVSGTTTRFSNSTSDGWLMQLSSTIPVAYNPYFNGWNANDAAATASVGIHHPSGDVKKISWDYDPTTSTDYLGTAVPGDGTHWRITAWDDGTTEPGSSGSPLFDQNHRITGQLHGGYASCTSITSDYYGKFALSMTLGARTWLDPSSTGIMTLDGYDPNVAGRVVGNVTDIDSSLPVAGVLVAAVGGASTTTNALGDYTLPLPDGTWDINYTKRGYEPAGVTGIVIANENEVTQNIMMQSLPLVVVLNEDFEGGAPGWTHDAAAGWVDNWHLSTEYSYSGATSYKCGDTGTGTYSDLCDARLISPVLTNLPEDGSMTFALRIESEISGAFPDSAYDGGIVELSVNGGAFAQVTPEQSYTKRFRYTSGGGTPVTGPMPGLFCFAGSAPTWLQYTVDLSAYAGDAVQFRFRFGSDAGSASEGWYVDDVLVTGYGVTLVDVTGLTISVFGTDVILRWDDDTNPYYRIYGSAVPEGEFLTEEGSTSLNEYTIVNGAVAAYRFYYVVGSATN